MKSTLRAKNKKRAIAAEDLFNLRITTSVSLSPDEKRIAYTVERIDKEDNKYYTNIFLYDLVRRESCAFTNGKHVDQKPSWSPDGSTLAFVSVREKKTGIYVMPSGGGAERRIVELEASIGELNWTPDGKSLVFALRYNDSHDIKDEKKKNEPPVYRHITRLFYRLDGMGFVPKDKFQIYALSIENAKLRKITSGKRDNHSPELSPDGKLVLFVSNRSKDPDRELLRDDLFVVPFAGGKERRVTTPAGPKGAPRFSPDGKMIAYIGHDNPLDAWGVTNLHIWTVGASGTPKARRI